MGCFLACFCSSKNEEHRKQTTQRSGSYTPVSTTDLTAQNTTKKPSDVIPKIQSEASEPPKPSPKKKVTFDSNVTTFGDNSTEETDDYFANKSAGESENLAKEKNNVEISHTHVVPCSFESFPPNHRYYNCRDYEVEDLEFEESILDGHDDDEYVDDGGEEDYDHEDYKEGDSFNHGSKVTGGRSDFMQSVLNPVQNVDQWKAVKSKENPSFDLQKENSLGSVELKGKSEKPNPELGVSASLSSWLVASDTPLISKETSCASGFIMSPPRCPINSTSCEARPILGAMNVEEVRQFLKFSSARSPRRSSDEQSMVSIVDSHRAFHTDGTVEFDSSKGIPNTNSKYREDRVVNWHSTPFQTRLERALRNDVSTVLAE